MKTDQRIIFATKRGNVSNKLIRLILVFLSFSLLSLLLQGHSILDTRFNIIGENNRRQPFLAFHTLPTFTLHRLKVSSWWSNTYQNTLSITSQRYYRNSIIEIHFDTKSIRSKKRSLSSSLNVEINNQEGVLMKNELSSKNKDRERLTMNKFNQDTNIKSLSLMDQIDDLYATIVNDKKGQHSDDKCSYNYETEQRLLYILKQIQTKETFQLFQQSKTNRVSRNKIFQYLQSFPDITRILNQSKNWSLKEEYIRAALKCNNVRTAALTLDGLVKEQTTKHKKPKSWRPRWDTFSSLLTAYRKRRDLPHLRKYFKIALNYKKEINTTILLNIFLAALNEKGNVREAFQLLIEAPVMYDIKPNTNSWNTVYSGVCKGYSNAIKSEEEAERQFYDHGNITLSRKDDDILASLYEEADIFEKESIDEMDNIGSKEESKKIPTEDNDNCLQQEVNQQVPSQSFNWDLDNPSFFSQIIRKNYKTQKKNVKRGNYRSTKYLGLHHEFEQALAKVNFFEDQILLEAKSIDPENESNVLQLRLGSEKENDNPQIEIESKLLMVPGPTLPLRNTRLQFLLTHDEEQGLQLFQEMIKRHLLWHKRNEKKSKTTHTLNKNEYTLNQNETIKSLTEEKDAEIDTLDQFETTKVVHPSPYLDRISVNTYLRYLSEFTSAEDLFIIINQMNTWVKIQPEIDSYNIVLHSYIKQNQINEAIDLLHKLEYNQEKGEKDFNLPKPDSVTYDTIISGLTSIGNKKMALKICERMLTLRYQPTIYTYTNFLSIQNSVEEVINLYKDVAKTIPLSLPFLNHCISVLGTKFNVPEEAIALFDKISSSRLYPSMTSLNIILHSLSKSNQVIDMSFSSIYASGENRGGNTKEKRKRNNHERFENVSFNESATNDRTNYNAVPQTTGERYPRLAELLQGFTGLQATFKILNLMYDQKFGKYIFPDSYSINTVLECILNEKNEEVTNRNRMSKYLFTQALEKGVEPNAIVCSTYLRSFEKDLKGASATYKNTIRPYLIKQQEKLQRRNIQKKRYFGQESKETNQCHIEEEKISVKSIYNLNVAVGGLFYVCGRVLRPDIALQIVYSLQRDTEEGTTNLYRFYQKGKADGIDEIGKEDKAKYKNVLNDYLFQKPYEEVLKRECNADLQYWKDILPVNKIRIRI